jgi:hypothetical protein
VLARNALLLPLLAGAALLVVAEFSTLYEVRAITAVLETSKGGAHHDYALLIIGIALVPMALGAVAGGSRPAAFACLVLALVAVAVVLGVDRPDVDETGLTRAYEQAKASPKTGFYLESLGAALALIGAVGTLVLRPGASAATAARPRPRADEPAT